MRWYRLSIGDYVNISSASSYSKLRMGGSTATFQSNTLFPRYSNPTPLNIEFEVRSFDGAGEGSTLCGIRVFSQSVTFFRALQDYCSKINDTYVGQKQGGVQITLEAGYDFSNPFMKKLGYTDTGSTSAKIIFKGTMAGITGDFNGKSSHINITGALTKKLKYPCQIQIKKGETILKEVNGEAVLGDDEKYYTSTLHQALQIYCNKMYRIFVEKDICTIKNETDEDIIFSVENFEQLAHKMRYYFDLDIFVDNQAGFIGIYKKAVAKPGGDKKTKSELAKEDAVTIAKLKTQASGGDYLNRLLPKKIKYSELITQPTFQGFSDTMEVVIAMRPDITLGSIIELPEVVMQMSGSFSTGSQYVDATANQINLAYGKTQWMVTECIHRGGFYGRSADSWATILLCVAYKKDENKENPDEAFKKAIKQENALSELGIVSNPMSAIKIY